MFEPTTDMFPGFDVPPGHAETVGARKARKAKEEEEAARRSSSSNSQSSASVHSIPTTSSRSQNASTHKSKEKTGFGGWFSRNNKKGIQEISPLSPTGAQTIDIPPPVTDAVDPTLETDPTLAPAPPTAPLDVPLDSDRYLFPSPPSLLADKHVQPLSPRKNSLIPMPYPPPTSELPPTPGSGMHGIGSPADARSQISSSQRTSYMPASVATSKTSIFSSSASGYETVASEVISESASYAGSSHLHQGPVFEAVERGSRTGSVKSNERDHSSKAASSPFARALAKIESASARITSARLSEEWEGLDDDESFQEIMFEKRLWALTAYRRLTQNKSLQSPVHELLINARPAEQRRVLQIHGSIADGWMLANRYPAATVYTLSSTQASPPAAYPAPMNHHSLYVPSLASQSPFPDNYFDAIISRSVTTALRNDEWARMFFDCMRVLKPGGQIEILSVDAHMSCEGPKMASWVDENLSARLESFDISKQASDTVLDTMEIVGLENIRRARIALPAQPPKGMPRSAPAPPLTNAGAPTPQDMLDNTKMMAFLGRHFYQTLYGRFMHLDQGDEWFWVHKELRDECDHYKTKMILTIACAQKANPVSHDNDYSD
ncbi:hypothetical protein COCSADRAFT_162380 [Bipolaris sorokiniana ND90Pr]|nr:uncharacterized protein COCSADRAFT_162380 [Bipolaris sorokiniana ND90Pr]EMD61844.1 hypothetical protein COCSADRAFT_162380 [Bipolaris sorokiniana ND90Pr]